MSNNNEMSNEHSADSRIASEPLVSQADARTLTALIRHSIEDNMILALNPQATRSQLIRERFERLVDDFCS